MGGHASARDRLRPATTRPTLSRAGPEGAGDTVTESNAFATNQLLRAQAYPHGGGGGVPRERGDAETKLLDAGGTYTHVPRLTEGGTLGRAQHDFGALGSMAAYYRAVGAFLDLVIPVGDELEVEFGAEVSIEGITAGVTMSATAGETIEDGHRVFELSGRCGLSVGLGETGAGGKVELSCGVTASGDSPYECANLVGLAQEQSVREKQFHRGDLAKASFWTNVATDLAKTSGNVLYGLFLASEYVAGDRIADLLWGEPFDAFVLQDMDDDDEVSRVMGVGLEGELEDPNGDSLDGGLAFEHRDVYRNDDGALVHDTENDLTVTGSAEFTLPPLTFTASVAGVFPMDRQARSGQLKASIAFQKEGDGVAGLALIKNGVRDAIRDLCGLTDRLSATWVGEVVRAVLDTLEAVGDLATGATGRKIGLTYDATSGDLTIAIEDETAVGHDVDLQAEVAELKLEATLTHTVFTTTVHVGTL